MSKSSIQYMPEGFHTVTPFIMVKDVGRVVEFARKAFGAEEVTMLESSDGSMWHACLKIGDSMIMFGDTMDMHPDMPGNVYLYVKDTNAVYQKALNAGARSIQEPKDQFYGDHSGGVQDSMGNLWWIATHIEDVKQDELERRARKEEEKMKNQPKKRAA